MRTDAPFTLILIAINGLMFAIETVAGGSTKTSVARKFGAYWYPDVQKGQWYRLITAMFLHFGPFHIACNMYSLYNLGPALERFFGVGTFLTIYLLSGIAGNVATYLKDRHTGRYALSAGASGAVFGLLGSWLVLTIMPQVKTSMSIHGIMYVLLINVAYGFANKRINMAAHAGGFVCGSVLTALIVAVGIR